MRLLSDQEIGKIIKQQRLKRGLTQTQLGEILGVGAGAVNKWEQGTVKNIKRSVLRALAIELRILPATLIGIELNLEEYKATEYTDHEIEQIRDFADYIRSKRGEKA